MEESVALDTSKQKQFVKSVRGIKKLLKKKSKKVNESGLTKEQKSNAVPKPVKTTVPATEKKKKINKEVIKVNKIKKRAKRGLVYLSHIPHGFYEQQMTEYFKQFGVVTNARVIKSKHTGNSKGYAFVEFKDTAVAEIVAETMNNYLMGKRLIKAVYIPPDKQKFALRKNWNFQNNPASEHRLKMKKALNADKTDGEELSIAKKLLANLTKNKEKLKGLGIDYDFFVPVDIPEALREKVEQCKDEVKDTDPSTVVDSKQKIKTEGKVTKSEQKKIKIEPTENKSNIDDVKKENNKNKKQKQDKVDKKSNEKQPLKENKNLTKNKNVDQENGTKKQSPKQKKIEEMSIKGPKNYIKINESDDDDSDDSVDFDSDEFEKLMENDDDELSSADESDEANEEVVQKLDNVKEKIKSNVSTKEKNKSKATMKNKQGKGISTNNKPEKRKNISNAPVTTKKAKFEKQNKKTLNKVIKKRK